MDIVKNDTCDEKIPLDAETRKPCEVLAYYIFQEL